MPRVLHGLRRPPDWFVRRLRNFNRNLEIRWHDRVSRWVIYERTRRGKLEPCRVLEGHITREFVPLDRRVMFQLREGDTWRRPRGVESILDQLQRHNETDLHERQAEEMRDLCHVASHDWARIVADRKSIDYGRSNVGAAEQHPAKKVILTDA